MYYNLPLFSYNVKVLKFFGFIEFENIYKISLVLVIELVTNICQIINFFFIWQNLSVLIMSLFMTAIIFNSMVRAWILMRNQYKFIKFMKEIECWYKEIELNNDTIAWNILKHLPKRTRAITNVSFIFGSISVLAAIAFPLFLEQRAHPFSIYTYSLDILKSPVYEIMYAVQSFIVMPFVICIYTPFTNLFISWLMFGISLLKILYKKFEALPSGDDPDQLKNLKILISYHQRIIRFGETLEKLVSFVCLVEFSLFTMMLCILLVCFLLVDNAMYKISTLIYIFGILYVLFISYWHTNEYSSESLKLANAIYNMDWTNSSVEVRKCVLILLIRSQTSLKIKAGGMYPMTLEAFQAILNAAYAYFNMLRGLMAK